MSALAAEAQNNFLIPNGTFLAELVIFVIVLFVLGRFVVPPVRQALAEREQMLRRQVQESQQAAERFEAAQAQYQEALAQARAEASRIRDEARAAARRLAEEQRERVEREVARIRERGERELAAQRAAALERLGSELGPLANALADRILGPVAGSSAGREALVVDFVSERGGGSPSVAAGTH